LNLILAVEGYQETYDNLLAVITDFHTHFACPRVFYLHYAESFWQPFAYPFLGIFVV